MNRFSFCAAAALTLSVLQAQQSDQLPSFRASVDLYTIHVAVTDASGAPVDDLGVEDFRLLEDGEEQEIAFAFPAREAPLDVAVVLDSSNSMSVAMPNARQDLHAFLDELSDRDCVLYLSFRDGVTQAVWSPPHHTDLRAMIDVAGAFGNSALLDATVAALSELERAKLLLEGGDAAEAFPLLEFALAQDPQRSEAHFHRAIALAQLDRPQEALEFARRATYWDPGIGAAHYLIGVLAAQLGDYETVWRELVNAQLAGYDVARLREQLETVSSPPEFFEERVSSPRLFVQLSADLADLEHIRAYRRATRAVRRVLAEEPATGVVARPEVADCFVVVVPQGFELGEPRTMSLRLEHHDTRGDKKLDVNLSITDMDDDEVLATELRSGMRPVFDWLARNASGA